jgi:hypothetical protein
VLYAAGCLAIQAGILPWKRQHLRQALQRQLIAAIAHLRSYHTTPQMIRRISSASIALIDSSPAQPRRALWPGHAVWVLAPAGTARAIELFAFYAWDALSQVEP